MDPHELEARVKNIDERTENIEQILPTLATKDDLREEGERTRRHFDIVAEQLKTEIGAIAEGHEATKARVESQSAEIQATLSAHDRRIMKLEAESLKRKL